MNKFRPSNIPRLQGGIRRLLLFTILALSFFIWIVFKNSRDAETSAFWGRHTNDVIKHLKEINIFISESETASLSYGLTGEPEWENQMLTLRRQLDSTLESTRSLISDNPRQQSYMQDLSRQIADQQNLSDLESSSDRQTPSDLQTPSGAMTGPSGPSSALAENTRFNSPSQALTRSIKEILSKMILEESDLLTQRTEKNKSNRTKTFYITLTSGIFAFMLIIIILIQLNKDIRRRKLAEEEARENQDMLQSIMDNAPLVIYLKDLEARYIMVNNKFKELMQVDETVIGKSAQEINKDKEATERRLKNDKIVISTKKPVQMEESVDTPDGRRHFSVMKFPLLGPENKVLGVCNIATDITESIRYQQQLIEARKLAEDAKSKEELFLANMSHEIRTPMNGIMGMTDLLIDTPLNERQKEFARTIRQSANSLLVIINDILDLSKIKAGKLTIEKIDFKLTEATDHIKTFFGQPISKKKLRLEMVIDENIPEVLTGDPFRLNQVLANLIGNAVKFTETGYIRLNIQLQQKTEKEVQLLFTVEDTGIGIPEDKMHLIFEDFSQAGTDISRRYGGTGLGLAICKQLLKMQGGEISVQSQLNKGTCFHFTISYAYDSDGAARPIRKDNATDYEASLKDKKILVVEDNEINQRLIAYVLEKVGAHTDIAANGREAIGHIRNGGIYDLVIMDLQMPEMDGYETTRTIRLEMNNPVPIIAMTATAMKGEKIKCFETGMNDYMSKPFEFTDLYQRIIALIGRAPVTKSIPGSSASSS
jgi:PAS domain S-box-containing protein